MRFGVCFLGCFEGSTKTRCLQVVLLRFRFRESCGGLAKGAMRGWGEPTPKFKSYRKSKLFAKGAPPVQRRHHGRVSGNVPSVPGFPTRRFGVPGLRESEQLGNYTVDRPSRRVLRAEQTTKQTRAFCAPTKGIGAQKARETGRQRGLCRSA